jgi:pyruvate-formate lyase-activating enzyme
MSSTPARIADVIPFSWVDGPGNRFVVFTQGCPFDCLACHNPETIPPHRADAEETTVESLVQRIRLVEPYLSGVTVSGGEATSQWRMVRDLFTEVRADSQLARLTTFVDTNGHALPRVWDELVPVTDGFMVDLKALDAEVHRRLTGHGNELVLDAIRYLHERGKLFEVRLPLVPGFNDTVEQLDAAAAWLAGLDPGLRVVVLGYRPHGVRPESAYIPAAAPELLERARRSLLDAGLREVVTV